MTSAPPFGVLLTTASAQTGYPSMDDTFPFAPAAGQAGSRAIPKDASEIDNWASGYAELSYGTNLDDFWKTPENAIGPASGGSFDILALGRGGSITLTFARPIENRSGPDFAVFENSVSDTFLELAWVEVSTDGIHFVRFPNFSFTGQAVGAFGNVDPTFIHGFAGKYRQSFATPFDLEQLALAKAAIDAGTDHFSSEYEAAFLAHFPYLDLNAIRFVRLIDIVGDGSAFDSEGAVIYDPFPTIGSAGFDLDGVAVINEQAGSGLEQSIVFAPVDNQPLGRSSIVLEATASSGLAVEFEVVSGPATLEGNVLHFEGLGQVVVRALQEGDSNFAAANPVLRNFFIADALQHIYLQPIANQLVGTGPVQLYARSSSGLPVSLFVDAGPSETSVDATLQTLDTGQDTGRVTVRASQPGGDLSGIRYAPAEDVYATFEIVDPEDPGRPQSFSEFQANQSLSGTGAGDWDSDGASDLQEFAMNTDPRDAGDRPALDFLTEGRDFVFQLTLSGSAHFRMRLFGADSLSDDAVWAEVVPQVLESESVETGGASTRILHLQVPRTGDQKFWRFDFEAL